MGGAWTPREGDPARGREGPPGAQRPGSARRRGQEARARRGAGSGAHRDPGDALLSLEGHSAPPAGAAVSVGSGGAGRAWGSPAGDAPARPRGGAHGARVCTWGRRASKCERAGPRSSVAGPAPSPAPGPQLLPGSQAPPRPGSERLPPTPARPALRPLTRPGGDGRRTLAGGVGWGWGWGWKDGCHRSWPVCGQRSPAPPRPARDGQGEGSGNDLPGPASPLASRRPATSSLMTQGTQGHGDRV